MARIRGLIHTHIGMINSIEALLVTLDLWFTRKPQHSHTLRTLYIIYLLAFLTCWLLHFICIIIFPKPILTPLHHSLSHTHIHSLIPLLIYSIIARALITHKPPRDWGSHRSSLERQSPFTIYLPHTLTVSSVGWCDKTKATWSVSTKL